MKTAEEIAEKYIKEYNDLVDYINDCIDKRIPITSEVFERRNDLSRLWLALSGNPNTKDGSWKHGKPLVFEMLEAYATQREQGEDQEPTVQPLVIGLEHLNPGEVQDSGIPSSDIIINRASFGETTAQERYDEAIKWWASEVEPHTSEHRPSYNDIVELAERASGLTQLK